jgi:hypothetical protein
MAEYQRMTGQSLRLNLSFTDLSSAHFVRVFLYDELGGPLATPFVNLAHLGNGVFFDNSVAMPNGVQQVKAKYVVYKDAGYSILDPVYSAGFDTFDKQELVPVQFPDDEVFGEISVQSTVDGRIQEGAVMGAVEQDGMVGAVEEDSAVGTVGPSDVAGAVEEVEVEGTIEC